MKVIPCKSEKGRLKNVEGREDQPQHLGSTRGVPASASVTEQLRLPELLVNPRHPARKRVAIERTHTIRIVLIPANAKQR